MALFASLNYFLKWVFLQCILPKIFNHGKFFPTLFTWVCMRGDMFRGFENSKFFKSEMRIPKSKNSMKIKTISLNVIFSGPVEGTFDIFRIIFL
jgi:hypothetical protein